MKKELQNTGRIDLEKLLSKNKIIKENDTIYKDLQDMKTLAFTSNYYINPMFFPFLLDFGFEEEDSEEGDVFTYDFKPYEPDSPENSYVMVRKKTGKIIFDYVQSEDIEKLVGILISFIAIGALTDKENK